MPGPTYEELFRLPPEARMELIYNLMESLDASDSLELQPWQNEELDRRRKDALANPDKLIDWDDVKASFDDIL